jgi:hypothetical protein
MQQNLRLPSEYDYDQQLLKFFCNCGFIWDLPMLLRLIFHSKQRSLYIFLQLHRPATALTENTYTT